MSAPIELKLFRSIKTGKGLIKLINNLKANRRKDKMLNRKRSSLTRKQRESVLNKTDSRCKEKDSVKRSLLMYRRADLNCRPPRRI